MRVLSLVLLVVAPFFSLACGGGPCAGEDERPPNDTEATASAMPDFARGQLCRSSEAPDFWRLTLQNVGVNDELRLGFGCSDFLSGAALEWLEDSGPSNIDCSPSGSAQGGLRRRPGRSGDFLVKIHKGEAPRYREDGSLPYTLQVDRCAAQGAAETEPNDETATATGATLGPELPGLLCPEDRDVFAFEGAVGDRVRAELVHGSSNLYLLDANGQESAREFVKHSVEYTLTTSRFYVALSSPSITQPPDYRLQVTKVP